MRVIFLHHSSFVVEFENKVLIFDYFAGDRVNGYTFNGKLPDYAEDTEIYMFASHSHQDHYDLDILRMAELFPNIRYVFSKDIRISPNFLKKHGIAPEVRERVTFVTGGNTYQVNGMEIRTYVSTDTGVAFYVVADGVCMFHAGDLSDWRMEGAGDLINGRVQRSYRHEINKLAELPIDLAFIPADPRLGQHQCLGLDYFLKNTDANYVFPMHMWQDYSGIAAYKKRISNLGMAGRIMDISEENQEFFFEDGHLVAESG